MIKHIITILWNNRSSNVWLLCGLLIMSVCMWFAVDYFYSVTANQRKSLGFDWRHVYYLRIGVLTPESERYDAGRMDSRSAAEDFDTFMERLKQYPAVEAACYTLFHRHYVWINTGNSLKADTATVSCWYRRVSPEYFRVFKVRGAGGTSTEQLMEKLNRTDAVLTEDLAAELFPGEEAAGRRAFSRLSNDSVRIAAVCENQKYNEYSGYKGAVYMPLSIKAGEDFGILGLPYLGIYIRVRPEADGKGFIRSFRREIRTQLMLGNLYLEDMRSMGDVRVEHLRSYRNDLYTYVTISAFLLLNVFLAILGVFWLRTQQRSAELGLRMALGSTGNSLRRLLIGEGLCLLTIAFIPAAVIGWNVGYMEIVPVSPVAFTAGRFAAGLLISYLSLAFVVISGIWFPSRRAMRIQPAEVLHDE